MGLLLVIVGAFLMAGTFAGGGISWMLAGIVLVLFGQHLNKKRRAAGKTAPDAGRPAGSAMQATSVAGLATTEPLRLGDDDGFEVGLAGESHYQETLQALFASLPREGSRGDRAYFEATLHPEPENAFDRNAVRVEAPGDGTVGYLPRETALAYRSAFKLLHEQGRIGICRAMACVGRGNKAIGVWISIESPKTVLAAARGEPILAGARAYATPSHRRSDKPGHLAGRHYSSYVTELGSLKREERHEELEALLLELVSATESESTSEGTGVAPAYYRELAILYRKLGRHEDEVGILERYARQRKAPGVGPSELEERLAKLHAKRSSAGDVSPR